MRTNPRLGGGGAPAAAPRRCGRGHHDPEHVSREYLAAARANGNYVRERGTLPMDRHDGAALTATDLASSSQEQTMIMAKTNRNRARVAFLAFVAAALVLAAFAAAATNAGATRMSNVPGSAQGALDWNANPVAADRATKTFDGDPIRSLPHPL